MTEGWMENFPLHLVKEIAAGGPNIDPKGKRVAQAELERRTGNRLANPVSPGLIDYEDFDPRYVEKLREQGPQAVDQEDDDDDPTDY